MTSRMTAQRAHVRIPQLSPSFWPSEYAISLDYEREIWSDTLLGVIHIYWYKYDA